MIGRGLLVAVALSALPISAFAAQPGQDQPQQPAPLDAGKENSGRVSVIDGDGAIYGRGPYDDETWELSVNAVVREGDELFTDDGAFAELELPGQTFVRLDGGTTVVLQRVHEQGVELALAKGSVYVSRGNGAQPAMVQTFGGAVELGGNSMARVGSDDRKTQIDVKVAKGSAEMRSDKTSIAVPENKTLVWTKGGSRSDAWGAARYDDFDRWNQTRENTVRGYTTSTNVSSAAMGSYELEGNGTWVMIDGYSAWRPTVVVADWRPYSYGHWSWTEPWGWTWVDDYRWGYTTSHYGRWYYRNHHGWVWYPDAHWGGSWVVWAAFGPHIGWAPSDYYGRPIYVHSYYSYYDHGAWSYSGADYFYTGGGYRPRGVRTSTNRTSTDRTNSSTRNSIGRNGTHQIRQFDQNTIRQYNAVPVRNARAELTPKHVADAAGRGQIKGVKAEARSGDFLARAVKDGGVRPEPWSDRGGREGATTKGGNGNDRAGFGGDKGGARDPVRTTEGWGTPGQSTRGGNSNNTPTYDGSSRGGSNNNTPTYDGSSRGGNNDTPSYDRNNDSSRGGGSSGGWTPPARNDSNNNSTPPARNDPPPRNDPPARTPPPSNNNDSKRSPPPPKQDNSSDRKSNDSNDSKSDKKPRSGWSNTQASNRNSGGSSRSTDAYTYDTRGGSSRPAPTTRAPSYDSGSSQGASSSAPSYKSGSSRGASSYQAPSNSGGRSYSSGSSSSASSSKSSGSSGSVKSSGGSSKSSGSSGRSSSSSSSSKSSSSSSSSKSSSSGKRK